MSFDRYMESILPNYYYLLRNEEIYELRNAYYNYMKNSLYVYTILEVFNINEVKDKYIKYVEEMELSKREFDMLLATVFNRLNKNHKKKSAK